MTAVANNIPTAPPADIEMLLDLARDQSQSGRSTLIETVSELFVDSDRAFSDRETSLISDILQKLVREVEVSVRRCLAERLADVGKAPHDLIVLLANDDVEVATPVLHRSPVLTDPDLIAVVRNRSREHQLSVANRRLLSEAVSDALVQTGDDSVITRLLENEDATISKLTIEYLVEQSRRIDTFQRPLLARRELPEDVAKKMYWWVSAALRDHIVENFEIDEDELDQTLQGAVRDIIADTQRDRIESSDKATELTEHLARNNALEPKLLIQVLREGEIALFETMFGRLAGLGTDQVKTLLYQPGGQSLAVAAKAAGIMKPDFASVFLLSRQGRPGDQTVDPDELSQVLGFFDGIDSVTARAKVDEWRKTGSIVVEAQKFAAQKLDLGGALRRTH